MRDWLEQILFRLALFSVIIVIAFLIVGCTTTTVVQWKCPTLAPPPASVMDGLESAGKKDPSAASWVVSLDKHYQKCDVINQETKHK